MSSVLAVLESRSEKLSRTRCGQGVDVGPDAVGRALELIGQGVPFNLRGVAGIGEFDAITRARSGALRAYCWTGAGAADFAAHDPGAADFVTPAPGCAQAFFAPGSN